MTSSLDILFCPSCNRRLGDANRVGANLAKSLIYYACPTCNRLLRVVKRLSASTAESPEIPSLVRCNRCGHYVDFGKEFWVNGEPYCRPCALTIIEENEKKVRVERKGEGEARSGHEARPKGCFGIIASPTIIEMACGLPNSWDAPIPNGQAERQQTSPLNPAELRT